MGEIIVLIDITVCGEDYLLVATSIIFLTTQYVSLFSVERNLYFNLYDWIYIYTKTGGKITHSNLSALSNALWKEAFSNKILYIKITWRILEYWNYTSSVYLKYEPSNIKGIQKRNFNVALYPVQN